MRQNLILSGILILLLSLTYYLQEIKPKNDEANSLLENLIITGEVTHLDLTNIKLDKVNISWMTENQLLSQNQINGLIKKLKSLKKDKKINVNYESAFKSEVKLKVNELRIALGDMTLDKEFFYVKINEDTYLSHFEGEYDEIIQEGEAIQEKKLNELKKLVSSRLTDLKENQFFRYFPDWKIQSFSLKQESRREFSLNFNDNSMLPSPYPGIVLHGKLREKLIALLTQIQVKNIEPDFNQSDYEIISTLTLNLENGVRTFQILRPKKSTSADVFLNHKESQKTWKVFGGSLKIFFITEQDFWDKRNISNLRPFHQEIFELRNKSKKFQIKVFNREPFIFENESGKVDKEKMDLLTRLVLNLKPFEEAERVSLLLRSDLQFLDTQDYLRIKFQSHEFLIWTKPSETIVCDLVKNLKFHYPHQGATLSFFLNDVIR